MGEAIESCGLEAMPDTFYRKVYKISTSSYRTGYITGWQARSLRDSGWNVEEANRELTELAHNFATALVDNMRAKA
jgi:hypothetical protein